MEVRDQLKSLIESLMKEINREGEVMIIHGGSEEKPIMLKHDRTVSLKNYVAMWDKLREIYPDTTERVKLQDIRDSL